MAGNLIEREYGSTDDLIYVYDAWGRLVSYKLDAGGNDLITTEHEYNGLNWRIASTYEYSGDEPASRYFYNLDWQLVQEDLDDDVNDANNDIKSRVFIHGIEYIDHVFAMYQSDDEDSDLFSNDSYESPVTFEDRWYLLNDAHYNVVAILDSAALPVERMHYDSFGKPHHHFWADLDGDGGEAVERGAFLPLADLICVANRATGTTGRVRCERRYA